MSHRILAFGLLMVSLGFLLVACQPAAAPSGAIQIRMGDFYFKPDTIRLKAGQEVRIELVNEGKIPHEFMIGREVEMMEGKAEHFEQDFFEGVQVTHTVEKGEWKIEEGEPAHAHLEAGGRATLTFTVPADRKGEWEIGCFEPGHYEAGMRGKLIVE